MKNGLVLIIACGVLIYPGEAATIQFGSPLYLVEPGTQAQVQIVASGFSTPVGAFDLAVVFDAPTVTYRSFTFGNSLGDPGSEAVTAITQTGSGIIDAADISLLSANALQSLQQGNFELGSIDLSLTRIGGSLVTIIGMVSDASGNPIKVSFGQTFVGSVPEPSTWMLFLPGLVAIVLVYARQTRTGRFKRLPAESR